MKLNKDLGMVLLAIWLILTGLLPLLNISFPASGVILAILAIAAGVLILLQGKRIRNLPSNLGVLLLSIWLIVTGLLSLLAISFPASGTILALLAIAAGILILMGR
jgi:hypothetical protein